MWHVHVSCEIALRQARKESLRKQLSQEEARQEPSRRVAGSLGFDLRKRVAPSDRSAIRPSPDLAELFGALGASKLRGRRTDMSRYRHRRAAADQRRNRCGRSGKCGKCLCMGRYRMRSLIRRLCGFAAVLRILEQIQPAEHMHTIILYCPVLLRNIAIYYPSSDSFRLTRVSSRSGMCTKNGGSSSCATV